MSNIESKISHLHTLVHNIECKMEDGLDFHSMKNDFLELLEAARKASFVEEVSVPLDESLFEETYIIGLSMRRCDGKAISPEHLEALNESALNHAVSLIQDGYSEGDLLDNIHMNDEDGDDGVDYKGRWELCTMDNFSPETPYVKELLSNVSPLVKKLLS